MESGTEADVEEIILQSEETTMLVKASYFISE